MNDAVAVYRCENEDAAEALANALMQFPAAMGVRIEVDEEHVIVRAGESILEVVCDTVEHAAQSAGCPVERLVQVDEEDEDEDQTCGWGCPVPEA